MKVLGVIPARFASTRFPGKPLAALLDRPMIQWVYERASQSATLHELCVATDDDRIAEAVASFGGRAVMTSKDHASGSDRIAEVASTIRPAPDLVVNIQGDEPMIDPAAIDLAVSVILSDGNAEFSTLACPIARAEELHDPNTVKVVLAQDHTALYFSRSPIPFCRDAQSGKAWLESHQYLKHIGIYVFRHELLMKFVKWPPGHLERIERLEQLRLLERGVKIHVARTEYEGKSVDTPADLEAVQRSLGGAKR
ncbi:3-deoxy-manno-octulosonate cytidylyltransferase [candidate division KSB1 bacterium]|nr:MAG: 3-deoxy-manno-octulosonate cytidylyltransferase [candidate division KSB1 bacterium]